MKTTDYSLLREFLDYARPVLKSENFQRLKMFPHHGTLSMYSHVIHVAYFSYVYGKKKNLDLSPLVRGALLHDYFLYDWHYRLHRRGLHGYHHPHIAMMNANNDFGLNDKEKNIVEAHMWPLTIFSLPRSREAWVVCMMDKKSYRYETFIQGRQKKKTA